MRIRDWLAKQWGDYLYQHRLQLVVSFVVFLLLPFASYLWETKASPLYALSIAAIGLTFVFTRAISVEWRPFVREVQDKNKRPIWVWVNGVLGWEAGVFVDHRVHGPSVWTAVVPVTIEEAKQIGPRIYPPDLSERVAGTRERVEPGWWWVFVEGEWACGHVLHYDAHGGPAGTLLSTPEWHGHVKDATAWGPRIQPPDVGRDAARAASLNQAVGRAMRCAELVRDHAEGEIKHYVFPWEEGHPDYVEWRDLLADVSRDDGTGSRSISDLAALARHVERRSSAFGPRCEAGVTAEAFLKVWSVALQVTAEHREERNDV